MFDLSIMFSASIDYIRNNDKHDYIMCKTVNEKKDNDKVTA